MAFGSGETGGSEGGGSFFDLVDLRGLEVRSFFPGVVDGEWRFLLTLAAAVGSGLGCGSASDTRRGLPLRRSPFFTVLLKWVLTIPRAMPLSINDRFWLPGFAENFSLFLPPRAIILTVCMHASKGIDTEHKTLFRNYKRYAFTRVKVYIPVVFRAEAKRNSRIERSCSVRDRSQGYSHTTHCRRTGLGQLCKRLTECGQRTKRQAQCKWSIHQPGMHGRRKRNEVVVWARLCVVVCGRVVV